MFRHSWFAKAAGQFIHPIDHLQLSYLSQAHIAPWRDEFRKWWKTATSHERDIVHPWISRWSTKTAEIYELTKYTFTDAYVIPHMRPLGWAWWSCHDVEPKNIQPASDLLRQTWNMNYKCQYLIVRIYITMIRPLHGTPIWQRITEDLVQYINDNIWLFHEYLSNPQDSNDQYLVNLFAASKTQY